MLQVCLNLEIIHIDFIIIEQSFSQLVMTTLQLVTSLSPSPEPVASNVQTSLFKTMTLLNLMKLSQSSLLHPALL